MSKNKIKTDTQDLLGDFNLTGLDTSGGLFDNWPVNNIWNTSGTNTGTISIGATGLPYSYTTGTSVITSTGFVMTEGADIKIGNRSLLSILEKIEDRLSILSPDPAKLEKFAALKASYEHYKLLEALCSGDTPVGPPNV